MSTPRMNTPRTSAPRMLRTTFLLASANALALGAQFLTTILVARAFGTSSAMDAFSVAAAIPDMLQYVLMLATLSLVFTPMFIEARTTLGESQAWSIALSLLALVVGVVLVALPMLWFFMPQLVFLFAPGFAPDTRALAVELSRLILPGLFYYATAGLLMGICFAYQDFVMPALNTLLFALLNLLGFFLFTQIIQGGVQGLMFARLSTLVILEIFLCVRVWQHKANISARLDLFQPQVRQLLTYLPPYMFGTFAWQIQLLVSRSLISTLGTGSVAAWAYGQRLADIPMAVLGGAIGTTFLPTFAEQVASGEKTRASESWNHALARTTLLLAPIAALLIALAIPLITVLLQRGSFDAASTQATALALMGLAIGLPARGIGGLVSRGLPAFKTRRVPIFLSGIAMGLTILFAFALRDGLGIFGIALATSLGEIFYACAGLFIFWRWLETKYAAALRALLTMVLLSVLVFFVGAAITLWVPIPFAQLVLGSVLGLLLFTLLAYYLRLPETRAMQALLMAQLKRFARRSSPSI